MGSALFADHPQQPTDATARRTQHGVSRIARLSLEMTAIHAVISFQMTGDRSNGLSPLEQTPRLLGQPLGFTSMLDTRGGVIGMHAATAQININVMDHTVAENLCSLFDKALVYGSLNGR